MMGILDLTFDAGLVALRGNNEAGKSTIFQAIAYALFGARALPEPLEAVVTYGKPAASLRVTLEAEVGGVPTRITRSARGAELALGARLVTGQAEVTNVVSELVGAPAALATALWFANQGSIRGALADGSKATTSLIEKLADFGQIDQLIELVQSNLPTGTSKPFEERLAQAEKTLADIGEPAPPADMTEAIKQAALDCLSFSRQAVEAQTALNDHSKNVLAPLQQLSAELARRQEELARVLQEEHEVGKRLGATLVPKYDEGEHERLKAALQAAQTQDQTYRRWKQASVAFAALPIVKSVWEGDGPSFISFCEQNEAEILRTREWIAGSQAELAALNKQVLEGVCQVCGLDYDAVPSVGSNNAQVKAARDELIVALNAMQSTLKTKETERSAVKIIHQQWQIYRDFTAKHAQYVAVDANSVPPRLEWTVPEPQKVDIEVLKSEIAALEKTRAGRDRMLGIQQELRTRQDQLQAQAAALSAQIAQLGTQCEGLAAAISRAEELAGVVRIHEERTGQARIRLEAMKRDFEHAKALHAERIRTYELAQAQAEKAREQLEELSFANTLLKKIRSARPAVVDRIWQVLLSAISHYFSQMRGTQSIVSRTDGAFLVDGRPIEGLSGSTLDILGLAIRVALLKTFLPACSFLVLDEPAAACDAEREAALIATIATAKFEQVVLVTHSDLADAFADQLLNL